MARMYDMETVNQAMRHAAFFVGPDGTAREKEILHIFAAMKSVETGNTEAHDPWETRVFYDGDGNEVFVHTHRRCGFESRSYKERGTPYCPNCGAIMDGRVEE